MNVIKIVFVLTTLDFAGTEKQFLETIRRLDRQRFDLNVLAFFSHGPLRKEIQALQIPFTSLDYPGIKGKFYPQSYRTLYQLLHKMTQYFGREKPHIVQSYLYWANIYGSLAAKIAGVPIIVSGRRDTMEECRRFSRRWLQNFSNLWVTAVVSNSQNVKERCLQQEKFLHSSKIQVIYNGIEVNRYHVNSHPTKKKTVLQVSIDAPVVGIIARLHPRKGHRDVLKAAARVLHTYPQSIFLLVGRDQGIQSELETLAHALGISQSVIFTGDREDIPEILTMLDVLVCASYIEGLSNAILEGMAAGKAVVATNIAGNPELVVHEQTGLLVPPGNPECLAAGILRLLGDPGLRERFGKAGRERAAALFQMDQMIHQTEDLYRSLVHWKGTP